MIDDIDIYCSAKLLIKQHKEDAAIRAAMEADACLERGDLDAKAVWMRVIMNGFGNQFATRITQAKSKFIKFLKSRVNNCCPQT